MISFKYASNVTTVGHIMHGMCCTAPKSELDCVCHATTTSELIGRTTRSWKFLLELSESLTSALETLLTQTSIPTPAFVPLIMITNPTSANLPISITQPYRGRRSHINVLYFWTVKSMFFSFLELHIPNLISFSIFLQAISLNRDTYFIPTHIV